MRDCSGPTTQCDVPKRPAKRRERHCRPKARRLNAKSLDWRGVHGTHRIPGHRVVNPSIGRLAILRLAERLVEVGVAVNHGDAVAQIGLPGERPHFQRPFRQGEQDSLASASASSRKPSGSTPSPYRLLDRRLSIMAEIVPRSCASGLNSK